MITSSHLNTQKRQSNQGEPAFTAAFQGRLQLNSLFSILYHNLFLQCISVREEPFNLLSFRGSLLKNFSEMPDWFLQIDYLGYIYVFYIIDYFNRAGKERSESNHIYHLDLIKRYHLVILS